MGGFGAVIMRHGCQGDFDRNALGDLLWGERQAVRTGHATTTLVVEGEMKLLIDPGLPGTVIAARLAERANLSPADITHVFLTSFI